MTFDDVSRTLFEALALQKIGTPVSLRVHLQFADRAANLTAEFGRLMNLATTVFSSKAGSLMVRESNDGHQLNTLASFENGATLLATLGRGSVESARLDLLLVGNHGIVRLEGAESYEGDATEIVETAQRWKSLLDESLRSGQPASCVAAS